MGHDLTGAFEAQKKLIKDDVLAARDRGAIGATEQGEQVNVTRATAILSVSFLKGILHLVKQSWAQA